MKIGLGIGIPFIRNYISSLFDPSKLFTGSTNGVWYDPSDINLTWRRNLLTYSEQFDSAVWTKVNLTVTSNAVTAPDGTLTADKLVESTSPSSHNIQNATGAPAINGIESIYLKAGERTKVLIYDAVAAKGVGFDLVAGTTFTVSGISLASTYSMVPAGNGWYRCTLTGASASDIRVYLCDASGNFSYTGDGTSGIYIWGAQLEQGSTATPYQRITDGIQDYLQYQAQPVLFQNAAGTQPVTAVEQPVVLMLDKSKGLVLGPELVTNGDFSNGTNGWTYTVAGTSSALISGGQATLTKGSSYCFITQTGVLTAGKVYSVTLDVVSTTGVGAVVNNSGIPYATFATSGAKTFKFRHSDGATNVLYLEAQSGTVVFDNISVRELPGNHAFNSSGNSANFPVLSARYNLLTKTEDFSDAVWAKQNSLVAVTPNAATAPDGTMTADLAVWSGDASLYQTYSTSALNSISFTASIYLKGTAGQTINFWPDMGNVNNRTIVTLNGDWQRVALTGVGGAGASNFAIRKDNTTASQVYIWGADLRVANDALNQPAYQRVNTATDYDTVGFKPYLRFNGVSQWLQTNSIDFTYGDKMFVSAGVRKLSDGATALLLEMGTGSPYISAPESAGVYGVRIGNNVGYNHSTFSAPSTSVISSNMDRAASTNAAAAYDRFNGVVNTTTPTGTPPASGNYGNYPMYIGARAGTSLWFNGRLYSLIVAGKLANAVEITETEKYVNGKTAAY